jgi:hypothetical protein
LFFSGINLTLNGKADVHWSRKYGQNYSFYSAKETYFDEKRAIAGSGESVHFSMSSSFTLQRSSTASPFIADVSLQWARPNFRDLPARNPRPIKNGFPEKNESPITSSYSSKFMAITSGIMAPQKCRFRIANVKEAFLNKRKHGIYSHDLSITVNIVHQTKWPR